MVFMPHWPVPNIKNSIVLGLERVEQLLEKLGSPNLRLPPVIHIAGTNGKGSTLAFLRAIFEDAGYKVHRYTSPHLINFNERIMLAGNDIADDYLYQLLEEVRAACEGMEATFFEITTAAAFLAFSRAPADVLLLETGLGGRLDATNVIPNPLQTIITPISLDHMEYLGTTLSQIATEKAGILKPNVECVVSWQMNEAMLSIRNKSRDTDTSLYQCGTDWSFEVTDSGFNFLDHRNQSSIPLPKPNLFGLHQLINAATATASILRLTNEFKISYSNIANGLQKARWPARMERITNGVLYKMLPAGYELWLDGAHNGSGAEMVAETIRYAWQDKPLYLINGRTGARDIKGFLSNFKELATMVYGVKVQTEPKAESATNIASGAQEIGIASKAADSIYEAIVDIIKTSTKPSRILICGSLYLAGDLILANRSNM